MITQALKAHLRFVKSSGPNNLGGPCPFHKGGRERKPSFYMNVSSGLFYCHTCHVKGTFVQFLKRVGAPTSEIDLHMELASRAPKKRRQQPLKEDPGRGKHLLKESLLGVFQYMPKDLVNDGFDPKLLKQLEIGFDKEEMRITFPLRDLYGNLVGISGRSVLSEEERDMMHNEPRYKVYTKEDFLRFVKGDPEGEARYADYAIKNHHFWWNLHNVYPEAFYGKLDCVIVVEGYKACMWLLQHEIENVIAMQGNRMTREQERVITRLGCTVILLLDANEPGKEGTYDTALRLQKRGMRVLCCSYPDWAESSTQPDDLEVDELFDVLDTAENFSRWRTRPCNIHLDGARRLRREFEGTFTRGRSRRKGAAGRGGGR